MVWEMVAEGIEHLSQIPGYDASYEVLYYNTWSHWAEHGWLAILYKGGQHYEIGGGHSVMVDGPQHDAWVLDQITPDQALEIMMHFEEVCQC